MRNFNSFQRHLDLLNENLSELEYNGNDNSFALGVLEQIDSQIGSINTNIEVDLRPAKQSGKKLGISQTMPDNKREKFAALARDIIDKDPNLTLEMDKVKADRKEKDYAFSHKDMKKYVYINCRPDGGRGSLGDDPHELMTAALCLLPKKSNITNSDEMDVLVELIKGNLSKVSGYKEGQVNSLVGNYDNLAMAVSAANAIFDAGYGNADKVYLTGQAWDKDVKQFQVTKYGMKDFNSSDFIIKKGKNYLGVSLKKKKRLTSSDPTLINKSFTTLLDGGNQFKKLRSTIDEQAGEFYVNVIKMAERAKVLSPEMMADLKKSKPTKKNWKQYIQRVPNDLVNSALKGKQSLFKNTADTVIENSELIANQLVQLIFKADLKDLQAVNFDFALVTGVGDYGPSKGVVVDKAEYKDIHSVASALDTVFSGGKANMILTPGAKQAFEKNATAANLKFNLMIGNTAIANITLRYKGNFRAAPNFLAEMSDEFKTIYKGQ
tara:strand:- start:61 stop:1539 length:1479 start_codon:yes stop_codon:yes gene_type:complete